MKNTNEWMNRSTISLNGQSRKEANIKATHCLEDAFSLQGLGT